MSDYLRKYVGTYRVMAEYDKSTNDWVRDADGNIDKTFDDFYIPLKRGFGKIMHYDKDILIIYINSITKGKSVIRQVGEGKDLIKNGLAEKIKETDSEILIYIKSSKLDNYIPYIDPVTSGKKIQPFSVKNLPKRKDYEIPKEDLVEYNKLLKSKGFLVVAQCAKKFIGEQKLSGEFRKSGLKSSEFIHERKLWENYIKYLKSC